MKQSIKTQVMDWVAANGGVTTFREVQRFILESKGDSYCRERRGYFVSAFVNEQRCYWNGKVTTPLGYFRKPGREKRYLEKQPNGKYHLVNG